MRKEEGEMEGNIMNNITILYYFYTSYTLSSDNIIDIDILIIGRNCIKNHVPHLLFYLFSFIFSHINSRLT